MEDSEQRKKRLKEMRTKADLAEGSGGIEGPGRPGFLSNPLLDAPSTMLSPNKPYAAPRFDFYTDPMNAFSSDRRRNVNVHAPPDYYYPPPNFGGSPMAQFSSPRPELINPQMTPSPTQVLPTAYRNPVWNGPRGPAPYNFPFRSSGGNTYPNPRYESPGVGTYPSPRFESPGVGTYPSPRFESPGGPLYDNVQGMSHRPNYSPNPSLGYRNSPSPSRGRGRGFWHNTRNPVSGRGTGHGSSSRGHWSYEDRACGPDRFYKRSMVEDPWKFLEPVMWNATGGSLNTAQTPGNSKPLTSSKSASTKSEGSSAASVKFNSGPSLAEYLAASFKEASDTEENA